MQSFKTSIIVPICSNNLFIQFRHNFIRSHKIWKPLYGDKLTNRLFLHHQHQDKCTPVQILAVGHLLIFEVWWWDLSYHSYCYLQNKFILIQRSCPVEKLLSVVFAKW